MKTKYFSIFSAIALTLLVSNLFSQDEMKIDPSISNFSKYLGTWHSNFNTTMQGKKEVVDYTVIYTSIADGHGIYMEEIAKSPSMGTYRCGNLIGFDPYGKKAHWYSVDNMGTAHDHEFTWVTTDHFTLKHVSMQNGKKYTEDIDCKYTSEKSCKLMFVTTLDGKETERSEGIFERVSK